MFGLLAPELSGATQSTSSLGSGSDRVYSEREAKSLQQLSVNGCVTRSRWYPNPALLAPASDGNSAAAIAQGGSFIAAVGGNDRLASARVTTLLFQLAGSNAKGAIASGQLSSGRAFRPRLLGACASHINEREFRAGLRRCSSGMAQHSFRIPAQANGAHPNAAFERSGRLCLSVLGCQNGQSASLSTLEWSIREQSPKSASVSWHHHQIERSRLSRTYPRFV